MSYQLTVTDVVEHVFCPKFTYYGIILGLSQYEEKRGTVMAGRKMHSKHEKTNISYMPNNIQGKKLISAKFYSKNLGLVGKIDEAIETNDEVIIIERKYTENDIVGPTLKVQLGLLAILIEENMHKPVKKALVVFSKKQRKEIVVNIDQDVKAYALDKLNKTKKVILDGILPFSKYDNRCLNCCYRKICPVGSLNNTE